jgi:hypothetical protein
LPQSQRNAVRAVYDAGDAAGVERARRERVVLHDLRHSMVAIASELGLSVPEIAEIAGMRARK